MKLRKSTWLIAFAAQSWLLGGCATSALWESGQFARFHEPAEPSNLCLFQSSRTQDVLVEYDECPDDSDSIRRRAFWLEQNLQRIRERHRPRFVPSETLRDLKAIPVCVSPRHPDYLSSAEKCASVATNGSSFVLYARGREAKTGTATYQEIGVYELPVYEDASGRMKQIALTPLTVAADLTIIGGYIYVASLAHGSTSW